MKVSKIRLNMNGLEKFLTYLPFAQDRQHHRTLINNFKKYNEILYAFYMKLSKGDKIDNSVNNINTCQRELKKLNANQEDLQSQLRNICFERNYTGNLIREAQRLETNSQYMELKKKETLLRYEYDNAQRREQLLKDDLSMAREELHINQKNREVYLRVLGVIVTLAGFIIFVVRTKYEANSVQFYFKEHNEYLRNELDHFKKNFDNKSKIINSSEAFNVLLKYSGLLYISSLLGRKSDSHNSDDKNKTINPSGGFTNLLLKYTGYMSSLLGRKSHSYNSVTASKYQDKSISANEFPPDTSINNEMKSENINYRSYSYYLGNYSGINYIASWVRSNKNYEDNDNNNNPEFSQSENRDNETGNPTARGYTYYIGKYTGINYLASWVQPVKNNDKRE